MCALFGTDSLWKNGSGRTAEERNERHGAQHLAVDALLAAREAHELLLAIRPDGTDEASSHFQLLDQRVRYRERCGRNQYAVEGRMRFPAKTAVAVTKANVADPELLEPPPRTREQRLDSLDGVELGHQRREHRRLIAAAGADLEHTLRRTTFEERLGHARHDVGLRDGLAVADRQCGIFVRAASQCLVDEDMSWHVADAIEHGEVADALLAQPLDQAVARARRGHTDTGHAQVSHRWHPASWQAPAARR